jgi:uncharacterized protein
LFLWLSTALLYGSLSAFASAAEKAGATAKETQLAPEPHIALLLPLGSGAFVRHAQAVRDGFVAAAKTQGSTPLPLRIYVSSDDPQITLEGYRQALRDGARLVVGPITRDGVSALASAQVIAVPTLALNVPDSGTSVPAQLYMLSLQVEAEARAVAHLAYDDGRRAAYTIVGNDALAKRMQEAFLDEFTSLGGAHVNEQIYLPERVDLEHMKKSIQTSRADMVFLTLDAERARIARPYLGTLPLYATSQVYPGQASALVNFDLSGIRFVGMPWLLEPDHAAVMIYPREDFGGDTDLERLYALGIDAFRVGEELLAGRKDIAIDGVTGDLRLGKDQQFHRGLLVAQFADGKITLVGATKP